MFVLLSILVLALQVCLLVLLIFDIILLASNYDDAICYVETMNLDGETNLKQKQALEATSKLQDSNFQNFRAVIKCEDPNAGVAYGRGVTEVERALSRRHESHPGQELKKISESKSSIKGFNFMDERVMNGNWIKEPNANVIQNFLRSVSYTHLTLPTNREV